jgi:predicted membrane protein
MNNSRLIIGLVLVLIGGLFLADNIFYIPFDFRYYIFSWPFLLVIIGGIMIFNSRDNSAGIILVLIGLAFLTFRTFHIPFRYIFQDYWPVILILIGFMILIRPRKKPMPSGVDPSFTENDSSDEKYRQTVNLDYINENAIFSGTERRVDSNNFMGGKITAVFGSADIDLRNSKLAPGKQNLDVFISFGGADIIVPKDWKVIINVTSIFGAFDDGRRKEVRNDLDEGKVLEINGFVLFGGGDLKT